MGTPKPFLGIISGERRRDHAEIADRVARIASGLHRLGVRQGASVCVLMRNDITFIEAAYAAMRLGKPAKIFIPSISSPAKIARIRDYGADLAIEGDRYADALAASEAWAQQTGALPEMLLKIADNYDEEVDNSVAAMTSLLEPIMIVFLAVIVGSIVIAMFLPLIDLMNKVGDSGGKGDKE